MRAENTSMGWTEDLSSGNEEAIMSRVIFNGHTHKVELYDQAGTLRGSWDAYNNIDSQWAKANYDGERHLANGTYKVSIDARFANRHPGKADADTVDGSFGPYGIVRFDYPGHPGVGLHSGRALHKVSPGAMHATHGCVRTTDEAMAAITTLMAADPMESVTIEGNSHHSAKHGSHKFHHPQRGFHAS
jgi:hypothetical protein